MDASGLAGLLFVVHIDARGGVISHNYHCQAGGYPPLLQGGHLLCHLCPHLCGDRLSVYALRHVHLLLSNYMILQNYSVFSSSFSASAPAGSPAAGSGSFASSSSAFWTACSPFSQ